MCTGVFSVPTNPLELESAGSVTVVRRPYTPATLAPARALKKSHCRLFAHFGKPCAGTAGLPRVARRALAFLGSYCDLVVKRPTHWLINHGCHAAGHGVRAFERSSSW